MKLLNPDTDFTTDYNEKGKYVLLYRLSLILSILFIISAILTFRADFYNSMLYLVSLGISSFCFVYLRITKKIRPVFWTFAVGASLVVTLSLNTLLTTLHYPDFIWAVCTIIFTYIGLGKKYGLIFLLFHMLSMCSFFTFEINRHLVQLKPLEVASQVSVLVEMIAAFFALTYLINQYLHFQSHTEKQLLEANNELNRKNNEITLLMKEIHHRIKNNLQLIVSLLRMQRDEIKSEEVQQHFTEAINRMMSISIIHQKLYQREDLKNFNFEDYILDLIREIKSMNQKNEQVDIDITIDIKDIGLKTLVPMGLLLNELLTNSFKHAFREKENKTGKQIQINIDQCSPEKICVYYEDNGRWQTNASRGFGLELVDLLTSQMEGTQEKTESKYTFKLRNLDLD
ncbi:MAG: hypothetical protein K0R65_372 [Crocinitomicaceae bacterium]|jgi:two-component sensor histidine kinase|nr:hypothetical protein [Crocinitomicaceae bacterium]